MGLIGKVSNSIFSPQPIYSRHKAKVILEGILDAEENFVFGLDKRDALFESRRTYWFITEMKLIFIEHDRFLRQNRNIYYFDAIIDMRVFEDEGILAIKSTSGTHKFELETELDYSFATQAVEQHERVQAFIEQMAEETVDKNGSEDGSTSDDSESGDEE